MFHPPLSLSSRGSSVPFQFLWWGWCFLHIWGYWYFSQQSWFQLLLHPVGMMYSAYKLNKQGDNIQPLPTGFLIWNQSIVPCSVLTCFLTCIQISQKAGKMVWYSHFWKFSAVCCDPHSQRLLHGQYSRSRCFSRILLFFFHDPTDVGNLISGSTAFSKPSLNIWNFTVYVLLKTCLETLLW